MGQNKASMTLLIKLCHIHFLHPSSSNWVRNPLYRRCKNTNYLRILLIFDRKTFKDWKIQPKSVMTWAERGFLCSNQGRCCRRRQCRTSRLPRTCPWGRTHQSPQWRSPWHRPCGRGYMWDCYAACRRACSASSRRMLRRRVLYKSFMLSERGSQKMYSDASFWGVSFSMNITK